MARNKTKYCRISQHDNTIIPPQPINQDNMSCVYIPDCTCKQDALWPAASLALPHMETCPHTPPEGHQLPAERTAQSTEEMKHTSMAGKHFI